MSSEDRPVSTIVVSNPWAELRRHTAARIALGRAGTSLPTTPHLEFQFAHAKARNAVQRELDVEALARAIADLGQETFLLASRAGDRVTYLQRPDAGRSLDEASRARLAAHAGAAEPVDVALVVGDGLSAHAIEENAVSLLAELLPLLARHGLTTAPISIVRQARVAVGDEIGHLLRARMVVVLIGERPGLSSPDSLGLYLTLHPAPGLTDESRNCISNVRSEGIQPPRAAQKLVYLMLEAFRRNLSGVLLKDEEDAPAGLPAPGSGNFLTAGD